MNLSSILTKAFGENTANHLMTNASQLIDGAKEAGRHWINTNKQILKDTPDELYRQADELVNSSILNEAKALEEKDLLNEYIYGMNLPDDISQATGRAFHKTGINARLLDSIRRGGYYGEVESRLNPLFDYISGGIDDAKAGVDNMATYMNDASLADEASTAFYRNPHAIRKNLDINDARMPQEVRDYIHTQQFDTDYTDYLRMKAWQKFDARDKDLILKNLDGLHGNDIKRVFQYRDDIDRLSLMHTPEDELHNLLPNYTYKLYDNKIQPMLVRQQMADEMIAYGAAKKIGDVNIGGVSFVRVQPIRDLNPERVQGALKLSGKYSRGSAIDMSMSGMRLTQENLDNIVQSGYTPLTAKHIQTGKEVDAATALYSGKADEYIVGTVKKQMSDWEELAKGRSDFAHDVISNTLGKLHKQQNSSIMKSRLKELTKSSSSMIQLDGKNALFVKHGQTQYNPITKEYYKTYADSDVIWYQRNKEVLERDYVNLADEGIELPIEADYVHKDYYRELLGYQQWRLSDGLNWKAQMVETLYKDFIDFVRGNISIKNPAVLLNNTIAGVMMQVADNVPIKLATQNTLEAFNALKEMHSLKSRIFKLSQTPQEHMTVEIAEEMNRLNNLLENNIANQAQHAGILKSFLDEGLWDRMIRANPDEPFDHSFIKNILLTEDSRWGINVRKWHDYSDMMNRVAMYKYLTQQATPEELLKKGIRTEDDIIRRIDEMFVNYSKLLPPMVAAMRRGGSIPFAQWFYKAPAFMIKQIRQHPVRALALFTAYETMQTLADDEHDIDLLHGDFEDSYIGDVHTDSKYSQNVLRPANWLDAVNPIGMDTNTWIPSYLSKTAKGFPDALGITTKEY